MRTRLLLSTAALFALLGGPAFAEQPHSTMPPGELSHHDMNFIKEAAIGGLTEVELGRLAESNAQSSEVKQFGARMVQDHSAANQQLIAIATRKGVTPPTQLDEHHTRMRDRLARLRGAEFDRAYMQMMVNDHDQDTKAFRHEAQTGIDHDIRQFARTTLSVIEQHDRIAHQVDESLIAVGSSQPPR